MRKISLFLGIILIISLTLPVSSWVEDIKPKGKVAITRTDPQKKVIVFDTLEAFLNDLEITTTEFGGRNDQYLQFHRFPDLNDFYRRLVRIEIRVIPSPVTTKYFPWPGSEGKVTGACFEIKMASIFKRFNLTWKTVEKDGTVEIISRTFPPSRITLVIKNESLMHRLDVEELARKINRAAKNKSHLTFIVDNCFINYGVPLYSFQDISQVNVELHVKEVKY